MASSFVPKDREELLLRTPLTFGFSAPTDMFQPRNSQRETLSSSRDEFRADASRERQRAKIKKMSRNTPHTGRVIPMKGLTDDLICSVEDNLARPRPLSALTDRDLGRGYRPPGSSRYSANTNKHLFAVGVVPVTCVWRDELIRKTQKAVRKALGEEDSHSRPLSRQSSRGEARQFDHLDDKALLGLLCKILHTDSIPRCQDWLNDASEDQKDIVLNMIRMAALGEEGPEDLPSRPPSRYVWRPPTTRQRRYSDPLLGESLEHLPLNTHPRYFFSSGQGGGEGGGGERGRGGGGGGLPKIEQELGKGGRRLKKSQSHDATPQIGDLEREVYKTIASTADRITSDQRQGKGARSKREKQNKPVARDGSVERRVRLLPPLAQLGQLGGAREKSVSSRDEGRGRERRGSKHRDDRSEAEKTRSKVDHTSH